MSLRITPSGGRQGLSWEATSIRGRHALGLSWAASRNRRFVAAFAAFGLAAAMLLGLPAPADAAPPADDGAIEFLQWDGKDTRRDPNGTMETVRGGVTHAGQMWDSGHTGDGVDIAIIDSGVSPATGLTLPGKVINGPDLSFESQDASTTYIDTFGHGTHLAGIMVGREEGVKSLEDVSKRKFVGMAPDARLVSLKVADRNGVTDVSQVIAAIDWVVQHRNDNGLNIRVLNLAFGTDSVQSHLIDPLSHAVEQAWKAGIVVVVAAGNDGLGSALRNPATNPYVITVGATDSKGSGDYLDDEVMGFSSCGTAQRHVDVVAPGKSIASVFSADSTAAKENPDAISGDLMRGSGTSQAAAVVSGGVALLVDQRPNATPDQIKALIMGNANRLPGVSTTCQGAGVFTLKHLNDMVLNPTPVAVQTHTSSTGTGSLDAARGTNRIEHDGVVLEGEQDIFGNAWDGTIWAPLAAAGASWSGGTWNGASWSGASWSGASWSGASWSGASWSGASWSGASWSGASWSGASWSGASWSGHTWGM